MKIIEKNETSKKKITFLVFAFFLLLNFATSGGHLYSIDDAKYFLNTENLALNQSIKRDPNSPSSNQLIGPEKLQKDQKLQYKRQGIEWTENTPLIPYFTPASLLLPFLTVPLYYFSIIISLNPVTIIGLFTNSIILSVTSVLIFLTGWHYFKSKRVSFVLSLIFLVTTWVWSYNTGMMLRPLAGLLVLAGFYFIVTTKDNYALRPAISGACLGFALLASHSSLIILPGLIGFGIFNFRKNKKGLTLFLISFLLVMLIQASLNETRFGSIFDFGLANRQDVTTHKHLDGIVGYIFSLGWGVFFNSPLLILFPLTLFLLLSSTNTNKKSLGILLIYLFVVTWFFFGTLESRAWSGYGGWGPRYFTMILPLLVISLGFLFEKFSKNKLFQGSFIGLAIFGFFVSLMGKLTWYFYGYAYGWQILKTHQLDNGWELLNYNVNYAPITLHVMALQTNFVESYRFLNIELARGLAPCPYDFFIYCQLGIGSFILIIAALAIVGILILKILKKKPNKNSNENMNLEFN